MAEEEIPFHVSTESWDDDVWSHVESEYAQMKKNLFIHRMTEENYEKKLHDEGVINAYTLNIAMLPPTQTSIQNEKLVLETVYLAAKFHFFSGGMWQAPKPGLQRAISAWQCVLMKGRS